MARFWGGKVAERTNCCFGFDTFGIELEAEMRLLGGAAIETGDADGEEKTCRTLTSVVFGFFDGFFSGSPGKSFLGSTLARWLRDLDLRAGMAR